MRHSAPQARHGRGLRSTAVSFVLLTLFSLVGCGASQTPTDSETAPPPGQPASASAAMTRSDPVWIKVPSIAAESSLVGTGLNQDRTIEVPPVDQPMQASWYKFSPTPGEAGPAVILGHVDGKHQKGVFWRLHEVKPGAEVLIGRQDGSVAEFVVDEVKRVPKKAFPTDEVYGDTSDAQVRLITCGGEFDKAARSYLDNWIVYGTLKQT